MLTQKKYRQLQEAPKGNRSAAGDPDDQSRYLKRKGRQREQLLRQFCREGPQGNSMAYLQGWERIFGGARG